MLTGTGPAYRANFDMFVNRDAPPALAKEGIASYYAAASFTDALVGRVISTLERLKLRDNTVVMLVADHGWHLGEKGMWSKMTLFEPATRVPLFMSAPGMTKDKACRPHVESLDIYSTLTDICGLKVPSQLEGRSLKPLLQNPAAPWDRPAYSFITKGQIKGATVRTERIPLHRMEPGRTGPGAVRLRHRSHGEPQPGSRRRPCGDSQIDEETAGCGVSMTSHERVKAALGKQPVDRVPVFMWFHPATARKFAALLEIPPARVAEAMGNDVRQTWVNNNYAMEGIVHEADGERHEDWWGIRWVKQYGFNQIEHYPLAGASREQVLAYQFPMAHFEDLLGLMLPVVREAGGYWLGCDVSPCVFEMYWRMRGMEDAMLDIGGDPELADVMFVALCGFLRCARRSGMREVSSRLVLDRRRCERAARHDVQPARLACAGETAPGPRLRGGP